MYHLRHDLGETRNLVDRYPAQVEKMQNQLVAWRKAVGAKMPTPNPDHDPKQEGDFWKAGWQLPIVLD